MSGFQKFQLKTASKNGKIYSIAELRDFIDFAVKRVYFVQGSTQPTGAHSHKIEKEFFVMIKGSCIATIDQGMGIEEIDLHGPDGALFVPNFVWHGFKNFSEDAILLALSSTNYIADRSDYLENYQEYLKIRDGKLEKKQQAGTRN